MLGRKEVLSLIYWQGSLSNINIESNPFERILESTEVLVFFSSGAAIPYEHWRAYKRLIRTTKLICNYVYVHNNNVFWKLQPAD